VDEQWTLSELVGEAAARIAALPTPKNGQVRAVPDDRTIRYYGTIGLLDRPLAMRGRTALYGRRHLAQVVAIKRLQSTGRSLAEIQALWPTLDDVTLARMSGVGVSSARKSRGEFWKREPTASELPTTPPAPPVPQAADAPAVELRIQLADGLTLSIAVPDGIALKPADVRALREAAAPLVELARGQLRSHPGGDH
jgi:DNA-binding transcriptional MerR regulator